MDDEVVAVHRQAQRFEVVGVAAHDRQARVVAVRGVVPLASGGEVVVDRHAIGALVGEERVRHVTADEPGAADDDGRLPHRGAPSTSASHIARRRRGVLESSHARHTANVLSPSLWRWQRIALGRKPARTSSGQRSRGS